MKTINPRFVATATGAIVGGSLLEQDDDATGLAIGLGIGAIVGHNFNVTLPDSNKMIYKEKEIVVPKVISKLDQMKLDMKDEVNNWNDHDRLQLPGNQDAKFDIDDIYGTLNDNNIRTAISEATSEEDLRRIRIAMNNPEGFGYVRGPIQLPGSSIRGNPKKILDVAGGLTVEAENALKHSLVALGYQPGEELDTKMALIKLASKDSELLILDKQTDKIAFVKGTDTLEIKLTSSHSLNGMSSYSDTNNIYAARSLNPFAKVLVNDTELAKDVVANTNGLYSDGSEMARIMGLTENGILGEDVIDSSHLTPDEQRLINKFLHNAKWTGMSPDDTHALLSATPMFEKNPEQLEAYINSAYQHLLDESAYRAMGETRDQIEKGRTVDLSKRLSHQQDFSQGFNVPRVEGALGVVNPDDPLRQISHKSYGSDINKPINSEDDGDPSEARAFREELRKRLPDVDEGKKADHNSIASNGKGVTIDPVTGEPESSVYNINTPKERNPYTASRNVRHENLGKNTIANTWDLLSQMGEIDRSFSTAVPAKRMSVDEDFFNRIAGIAAPDMALMNIADGGSIANKRVMSTYNTTGMRTLSLAPDRSGIVQPSEKVERLLKSRATHGLDANRTVLGNSVVAPFRNIDSIHGQIKDLGDELSTIQSQIEEIKNKVIPNEFVREYDLDDESVNLRAKTIYSNTKGGVYNTKSSLNPEKFSERLGATEQEVVQNIIDDYKRGVPFNDSTGKRPGAAGLPHAYTQYDKLEDERKKELAKLEKQANKVQSRVDVRKEWQEREIGRVKDVIQGKLDIEGESSLLRGMLQDLDSIDVSDKSSFDAVQRKIEQYDDIVGTRFKPGEVIGLNGNGTAVTIPKEFNEYNLQSAIFTHQDVGGGMGDEPRYKLNMAFKGTNNIGAMDSVKVFGVDNKENLILQNDADFAKALAIARFVTDYEPVTEAPGKTTAVTKFSFNRTSGQVKSKEKLYSPKNQIWNESNLKNLYRDRISGDIIQLQEGHVADVIQKAADTLLGAEGINTPNAYIPGSASSNAIAGKAQALSFDDLLKGYLYSHDSFSKSTFTPTGVSGGVGTFSQNPNASKIINSSGVAVNAIANTVDMLQGGGVPTNPVSGLQTRGAFRASPNRSDIAVNKGAFQPSTVSASTASVAQNNTRAVSQTSLSTSSLTYTGNLARNTSINAINSPLAPLASQGVVTKFSVQSGNVTPNSVISGNANVVANESLASSKFSVTGNRVSPTGVVSKQGIRETSTNTNANITRASFNPQAFIANKTSFSRPVTTNTSSSQGDNSLRSLSSVLADVERSSQQGAPFSFVRKAQGIRPSDTQRTGYSPPTKSLAGSKPAGLAGTATTFEGILKQLSGDHTPGSVLRTSGDLSKVGLGLSNIGTISSTGGTGQNISEHVSKALLHTNSVDEAVSKMMALKADQDTGELVTSKNSISETISRGIAQLAERDSSGRVNREESWAMGQLVNSLTEGKASASALEGMKVLATDRIRHDLAEVSRGLAKTLSPSGRPGSMNAFEREAIQRIDTLLGDGYSAKLASGIASSTAVDGKLGGAFTNSMVDVGFRGLLDKIRSVEANYGSGASMLQFLQDTSEDGAFGQNTANLFRYAYNEYGVSLMMASPDSSEGYATGSGKLGKTISHIAQKQLLSAGMTEEMLSIFGNLDPQQLYDLKAVTTLDLDMKGQTTLNQLLDSMVYNEDGTFNRTGYQRAKGLVETLVNAEPERVNEHLRAYGASQELIDQEFLRFTVKENEQGLTNLPVFKNSTTRYGEYISDDEKVTGKPIQKLTGELLKEAFLEQYSPNGSEENVANLTRRYVKRWTNTVGNPNNPMLKGVLARHAPNSSYQKVVGTGGEAFGKVVDAYQKEGKSVAGITRTKAAQVLQAVYGNEMRISALSESQLIDKYGPIISNEFTSIDRFMDKNNVLMAETIEGDRVPLYTFLNREPSHSSFSVSPYALRVFGSGELNESVASLNSVYIHKNDSHYTSLMFGDFDNDHVLMYSISRRITNEEAENLEAYTNKIASVRNDLVPLIKSLGVKGKNESGIYDITRSVQVLEDDIMKYMPAGFNSVDEFRFSGEYYKVLDDIVNERGMNAVTKGGIRKTLSANTVQLSINLSSAIHQAADLNSDFLTQSVAKSFNHALVENLIKTQHISTENLRNELPVERIFKLRKALEKGSKHASPENYRKALTGFFTDMLDTARKGDQAPELQKLEAKLKKASGKGFEEIIADIVNEDIKNIKNPSFAPIGILDYSRAMAQVEVENYDAGMLSSHTRDMVTATHGDQISLAPFVNTDRVRAQASFESTYDELFRAAKQNILDNKRTLMLGGAALIGAGILTQKQPDFSVNKSITADTQAGTMAASHVSAMQTRDSDAALQSLGRQKNEYIRPGTGMDRVKQNYNINAEYAGNAERQTQNTREAIFGKNITNVNINNNNSYY